MMNRVVYIMMTMKWSLKSIIERVEVSMNQRVGNPLSVWHPNPKWLYIYSITGGTGSSIDSKKPERSDPR